MITNAAWGLTLLTFTVALHSNDQAHEVVSSALIALANQDSDGFEETLSVDARVRFHDVDELMARLSEEFRNYRSIKLMSGAESSVNGVVTRVFGFSGRSPDDEVDEEESSEMWLGSVVVECPPQSDACKITDWKFGTERLGDDSSDMSGDVSGDVKDELEVPQTAHLP